MFSTSINPQQYSNFPWVDQQQMSGTGWASWFVGLLYFWVAGFQWLHRWMNFQSSWKLYRMILPIRDCYGFQEIKGMKCILTWDCQYSRRICHHWRWGIHTLCINLWVGRFPVWTIFYLWGCEDWQRPWVWFYFEQRFSKVLENQSKTQFIHFGLSSSLIHTK